MEKFTAAFDLVLEQVLPQGQLAVVSLPQGSGRASAEGVDVSPSSASIRDDARDLALHADEWALADSLSEARRTSFVGGRLALRAALHRVAPADATRPVLRTARGAPAVPAGVLGSVSHKRRLAVALAATASETAQTIGVDLEEIPSATERSRPDLARKILTSLERHLLAELEAHDEIAYREAVRLRFALKEAVYKCIDPHVARYVRFQEVEVFPRDSGETLVRLSLPEFAGRDITVQAWWSRLAGHLVATAAATALRG